MVLDIPQASKNRGEWERAPEFIQTLDSGQLEAMPCPESLEFDWAKEELVVHMHHLPRNETYKMDNSGTSHGGGDTVLADNFVRVIRDRVRSVAPISAGLLSVLMCLKAKESTETNTFQEIRYADGDLDLGDLAAVSVANCERECSV